MKVRRPEQREQSVGMDDRISAANELKDEAEAKKAFLELLIKNENLNGDAPRDHKAGDHQG
jgi:hypothetical protein